MNGGITREPDKEPSLHCSSIYITYKWSMLQQYLTNPKVYAATSCFITHPHVFSIRLPCFLHVPWHHTFNLCCTCAYHVYTMRNPCPLMSLLTLSPSCLLVYTPSLPITLVSLLSATLCSLVFLHQPSLFLLLL